VSKRPPVRLTSLRPSAISPCNSTPLRMKFPPEPPSLLIRAPRCTIRLPSDLKVIRPPSTEPTAPPGPRPLNTRATACGPPVPTTVNEPERTSTSIWPPAVETESTPPTASSRRSPVFSNTT